MSASHRRVRRFHGWAVVAVVSALTTLVAIIALLLDSSAAHAASTEPEPIGHLVVHSDRGLPAEFAAFSPGEVDRWHLTSTVTSAPSELFLRVDRSGPLIDRPGGLQLEVASCPSPWTSAGVCTPGDSLVVASATPLRAQLFDAPLSLGRLAAGATSYLQLSLSLPASSEGDASLMGQPASVDVRVTASGVGVGPVSPSTPNSSGGGTPSGGSVGTGGGGGGPNALPSALAWTGTQPGLLGLVAAGFLATGILVLAFRRRLTRPRD